MEIFLFKNIFYIMNLSLRFAKERTSWSPQKSWKNHLWCTCHNWPGNFFSVDWFAVWPLLLLSVCAVRQLSLEGRSKQLALHCFFLEIETRNICSPWRYLNVRDIVYIPIFIEVFYVFLWQAHTRSSHHWCIAMQTQHVMYTGNEHWLTMY